MAYPAESTRWPPHPETGPARARPDAPATDPIRESPAQDTLSWIRALASQWEDEHTRPRAAARGLRVPARAVSLTPR
jgi:hypothetical protein